MDNQTAFERKPTVRWTGWLLVFAVFFGLQPALPAYAPPASQIDCIAVEDLDGLAHWSEQWNGSVQSDGPIDSLEGEGDEEESHSDPYGPLGEGFQNHFQQTTFGLCSSVDFWFGVRLGSRRCRVPYFIVFRKLII